MISDAQRLERRRACIRYILAFIEGRDPNDSLLRTFVDNWFAYYQGGDFLTASGKARWFNRGDLAKKPAVARLFHYHSRIAINVFEGRAPWEFLVKDHVLPLSAIKKGLQALDPLTEESIEEYLIKNYRVALITDAEHRTLATRGLKSKLPDLSDDAISRYSAAGIILNGKEAGPLVADP